MSVRLTTPDSRPDIVAPGMVEAVIADALPGMDVLLYGGPMDGEVVGKGVVLIDALDALRLVEADKLAGIAGVRAGVGGPDDAGEAFSTTHILYLVRICQNDTSYTIRTYEIELRQASQQCEPE
jgi:hypothetical protein